VVEISATSKETAVLLLPDGASRSDLRPVQVFKEYALKNARSWYAFVNGRLGWMVGDLYLITGVDKSSTWSVLAKENHSEDINLSLKLKATPFASGGGSCRWEWETSSSYAHSGPRREPGSPAEQHTKDQTVFLRGFKVTVRSPPRKSAAAISIVASDPSTILSKASFIPFSQTKSSGTSSFFRNLGTTSGQGGGALDEQESVEYFHTSLKVCDRTQ
jgi:hypothetical protein